MSWEKLNFMDCIQKTSYSSKIAKKEFKKNGRFPIVSQEKKLINGFWDNPSDLFKCEDKGVVVFGDHTKTLKYINFDFVIGADGVKILKPVEKLDPKFFYYQLRGIQIPDLGYARHFRLLKEYDLIIPPISEQKQIVETLDKAFEKIDKAIANIKRNIQNTEELLNSKIEELFDSCEEMKLISEMCLKTRNISWKAEGKKEFKYLDLSSVKRNDNKIISHSIVNCDNAPSRAKKIINERDVIFATTRPTLKRAVVIDKSFDKSLCSTGFVVLRSNGDVSPEWIYNFLFTKKFLLRMEKLQRGASYPAVSDNDVKKTKMPLPINSSKELLLLDELKKVRVGLKSLKHDYNYKINSLKELKKSILEKAFKGELINAA